MTRVILFNKPYGVPSQFTDGDGRRTLKDYIDVPGIYAAGRLDRDSAGLFVLTDNGRLQARIAHPKNKMTKTYWAQVEGRPDHAALTSLATGVPLKDGLSKPATVRFINAPAHLWPRDPPIRVRKFIPDSWIELTLSEGRNRQVRRMTAHVGHPTLRLIRTRIGDWHLGDLAPGSFLAAKEGPRAW